MGAINTISYTESLTPSAPTPVSTSNPLPRFLCQLLFFTQFKTEGEQYKLEELESQCWRTQTKSDFQ